MSALASQSATSTRATYEAVASEYYDPLRHPTCRNFRDASTRLIRQLLKPIDLAGKTIVDVGAGDSVVAEIVWEQCGDLSNVTLIDSSASMLAYSEKWARHGARLVDADCHAIPLETSTVDILVASLGDPFNTSEFWLEVRRLLTVDGLCVFTTPSHDWAASYRSQEQDGVFSLAEFTLSSGEKRFVPSYIHEVREQLSLIRAAGLRTVSVAQHSLRSLAPPYSPKLMNTASRESPIVTGYFCQKEPARSE